MSDKQAARLDDHVDGPHDFDFFLGELAGQESQARRPAG